VLAGRGARWVFPHLSEHCGQPFAEPSPSPSPKPSPTPSPSPTLLELGEPGITPRDNRVILYRWDRNVNRPIEPSAGKDFSRIVVKF
jgi:hypothetical protein